MKKSSLHLIKPQNSFNIDIINERRWNLILPSFLKEALTGIILGDGHLTKVTNPNMNSHLKITFTSKNELLARYIYGLFIFYINPKGILKSWVKSTKDSDLHERISFTTIRHPVFTDFFKLFYSHKSGITFVKTIPSNIEELLTEVSLAFYIMGDGNYNPVKKVCRFSLNSYTKEEVILFSKTLEMKWGVKTRIEKESKLKPNQYRLIVNTSQISLLQNIVKNHMHPSMLYRIGMS